MTSHPSMRALIAPSMRKSQRLDVLSVTDMCVDLILQGNVRPQFSQVEQSIDNYVLELGGSANILISQMVKLGAKAGVIGWVEVGSAGLDDLDEVGLGHVELRSGEVGVVQNDQNESEY